VGSFFRGRPLVFSTRPFSLSPVAVTVLPNFSALADQSFNPALAGPLPAAAVSEKRRGGRQAAPGIGFARL